MHFRCSVNKYWNALHGFLPDLFILKRKWTKPVEETIGFEIQIGFGFSRRNNGSDEATGSRDTILISSDSNPAQLESTNVRASFPLINTICINLLFITVIKLNLISVSTTQLLFKTAFV